MPVRCIVVRLSVCECYKGRSHLLGRLSSALLPALCLSVPCTVCAFNARWCWLFATALVCDSQHLLSADGGMQMVICCAGGVCNHIDVVLDAVLALYVFVYFCRILCSVHAYFMHTVMRVECVDTGTISCTHEFVCFSLVHAVLLGAAGHGYVGHRLCGVYGIVCWCACMDIMCEWWLGRNRSSFACRLA